MVNISKYKRPVSVMFSCVAIALVSMVVMNPSYAVDIFGGEKAQITDTVGDGSVVQFAILTLGVVGAAITGYLTKNWGASIGGFVVGMLFLNITMKVVGLA